ncbi:MAG TPA: IclR family transcriptional regulator [Streptosporangiaceae bacterium]|nr:IclR family transcriptional regulator [Streptosporangiaceae bacterium]
MAEPAGAPGRAHPPRDGLVGSLLHGLTILDMFDRDRPVISLADIAQRVGVHRSSASRLAATLAFAGYLEPAGEQGKYRLAGKVAALGELAAADTELRRAALPCLQDLVGRLGETGHLAVLEGTEAVTIEVVDGWHSVRMHSWVGKRSPAHCSSMGKALLADLDPDQFAALYPGQRLAGRTPATITRRRDLQRHLAVVRAQGYAEDREELEAGLCCVAAPVFDRLGKAVASISVSGPVSRIHDATVPGLAQEVRHTAWRASLRLGAPRHIPGWPEFPDPPPPADAGRRRGPQLRRLPG